MTIRNLAFFQDLSDEEINFLVSISTVRTLKKKERLTEPGKPFNYLFIVSNGLLRWFFNDGNTIYLTSEKEVSILGVPESYTDEDNSKYTVEAVVESTIILFDKNKFEESAFQYKGIFDIYLKSLKLVISVLGTRTEQLCSTAPHLRYESFLLNRPFTLLNACRKDIAKFLGITPNSLSRMTARVYEKNKSIKKHS